MDLPHLDLHEILPNLKRKAEEMGHDPYEWHDGRGLLCRECGADFMVDGMPVLDTTPLETPCMGRICPHPVDQCRFIPVGRDEDDEPVTREYCELCNNWGPD